MFLLSRALQQPAPRRTSGTALASKAFLVALALCAIAGLALFMMLRPGLKHTPPLTVQRTNLLLRGGLLYQQGAQGPFSGLMVEHYPDGAVQSRSIVLRGQLNGISEGWHTNGQLQIREQFTNGVSHGLRTKWHPSGARMSESTVVAGKISGTFRRWHDNGVLAEEIQMRDGKPHGLSRVFYRNGFLKAEATLVDGEFVEQKTWNDGESEVVAPGAEHAPATGVRPRQSTTTSR